MARKAGVTLAEKWADGVRTLHGIPWPAGAVELTISRTASAAVPRTARGSS